MDTLVDHCSLLFFLSPLYYPSVLQRTAMASVQIGFRQLQILKYAISTSPDGLLPSLSFSLPILGYNLLNFDMLAGVRCYNLES